MRLDGREPSGKLVPIALGLIASVLVLMWWSGAEGPSPAASTDPEVAASPSPPSPADAARGFSVTRDASDELDPLPEDVIAPQYGTYDEDDAGDEEDRRPAAVAPRSRVLPPGTSADNARVLRRLPHSPHDRSPVGGIGSEGLHIDRITMGTSYRDGACSGPVGKFSVRDDEKANVCFRAVHRRTEQQVIVRWERNGVLVRRTFVTIGDGHAYRTRAALPLRRKYPGDWTVRIMGPDGVELASQSFQVLR